MQGSHDTEYEKSKNNLSQRSVTTVINLSLVSLTQVINYIFTFFSLCSNIVIDTDLKFMTVVINTSRLLIISGVDTDSLMYKWCC
jgi:hypothetical protein